MAIAGEVARRITDLVSGIPGAIETGYRAVSAPFETAGPPIQVTEFEPGTVSPGAVAAKLALSIMAGARSRANYDRAESDRLFREERAQADLDLTRARIAELSRPRTMAKVGDREYEIGPLTGDAAERALFPEPTTPTTAAVGSAEWKRQQDVDIARKRLELAQDVANRIKAAQEGALGSKKASDVAKEARENLKALDEEVDRNVVQKMGIYGSNQVAELRRRVLARPSSPDYDPKAGAKAAGEIGLDADMYMAYLKANPGSVVHEAMAKIVDQKLEDYTKSLEGATRGREQGWNRKKRARLQAILDRASSLEVSGLEGALGPDYTEWARGLVQEANSAFPE